MLKILMLSSDPFDFFSLKPRKGAKASYEGERKFYFEKNIPAYLV